MLYDPYLPSLQRDTEAGERWVVDLPLRLAPAEAGEMMSRERETVDIAQFILWVRYWRFDWLNRFYLPQTGMGMKLCEMLGLVVVE